MNNPCLNHCSFPEIEKCDVCREAYENVLLRWYGPKAVENFRANSQREILLAALRSLH